MFWLLDVLMVFDVLSFDVLSVPHPFHSGVLRVCRESPYQASLGQYSPFPYTLFCHLGKSATIRESNPGSGVCKEHYV